MSNVADAVALVSARSAYNERAREMESQAESCRRTNRPFTAKMFDAKAQRLRRAAVAELVNPEVPNDA